MAMARIRTLTLRGAPLSSVTVLATTQPGPTPAVDSACVRAAV